MQKKSLFCILYLLSNARFVQSTSNFFEPSKVRYDEPSSSSSDNLVPFQEDCIARVSFAKVDEGIRLDLLCAVGGMSYLIPSIGAEWIMEMTITGNLISDETIMTLPAGSLLNQNTNEICLTELPKLWNNEMVGQSSQELQDHRRLNTPTVSLVPSRAPSKAPSMIPSQAPSKTPSMIPSQAPSKTPSMVPSQAPSKSPSLSPSRTPSRSPSVAPSKLPSNAPSNVPSRMPSLAPSNKPSKQASAMPSRTPSLSPSKAPSLAPSSNPSLSDVPSASIQPSSNPSGSSQPSLSKAPSLQPSTVPSVSPSKQPSSLPSIRPSNLPSVRPSIQPSNQPSIKPSNGPSTVPSRQPSLSPSKSLNPSNVPSASDAPSLAPSGAPSKVPSAAPSQLPTIPGASARPSAAASSNPSNRPSTIPSVKPSNLPSVLPSLLPSASNAPSKADVTAVPTPVVAIDREATISVEIGIDGLNSLDAICSGFDEFLSQGIQDAYGTGARSTITCTKEQELERRKLQNDNIFTPTNTVLDYEKPVLITVSTTFPNFRTAPRQFGFLEFLEQLVVSDRAITELPQYIQQALGSDIEGVHVTLVYTPKKPILIVAFGEDAPTASPTVSNGTQTPGSPSGARGVLHQSHLSWLLCSIIGGSILVM